MAYPFECNVHIRKFFQMLFGEYGTKVWDNGGNLMIETPQGVVDIISGTDAAYLNSKRLLTVADQGATRFGFPSYSSGVARVVGTIYQAETDGWLNLVLEGDYMNDLNVYVGSASPPTTLIWRQGDSINGNTKYNSALIPISAGTYYRMLNGAYGYERGTYRWFPAVSATAIGSAGREVLTEPRTYYVRTNGSDTNNGLSNTALGAFATIQKAVDIVCDSLDMGRHQVTIQVADGTYSSTPTAVTCRDYVGRLAPWIIGNTATPSSCILSVATHAVRCVDSLWYMRGFKITTTNDGIGILAESGGTIRIANMVFATCSGQHLFAKGGRIYIDSAYTISGECAHHMISEHGGIISNDGIGRLITITGTPHLGAFAFAQYRGSILYGGNTYSGSATGTRYFAATGGFIQAGTATPPGDAAGSVTTNGYFTA